MAEKPEDLNLPNSVVFRLIKEEIPPGIIVAKDVRLAISKAASVFVLYCTATANAVAQSANRKTLSGNDVVAAVDEMEFEEFKPVLQTFLREYKENTASKKQQRKSSPGKAGPQSSPKGKPGPKKSPFKEPIARPPPAPTRMVTEIEEEEEEEEENEKVPGPSGASLSRPQGHVERMEEDDLVIID